MNEIIIFIVVFAVISIVARIFTKASKSVFKKEKDFKDMD